MDWSLPYASRRQPICAANVVATSQPLATQAGLATLPSTLIMFLLSKRFGRLADRSGPRLLMGLGPLVSAAGLLLYSRAVLAMRVPEAHQVSRLIRSQFGRA